MSHAIANPSPATAMRRLIARVWDDPDSRSTVIGVIGVILIHLFLFFVTPHFVRFDPSAAIVRPRDTSRQFNVELAPDTLAEPEKQNPQQFVETNPDAPENTPDRTNNFGAQNQQVAQEKPTPNGESERPALEGKKDFQSNQIVSGRLQDPQERLAAAMAAAETLPTPPTATVPRAEQNPLPGLEKLEGDNPDGIGTNVAQEHENVRPIPERIEGKRDAPDTDSMVAAAQPMIDPKRPRPRPQIVQQQQVRPAILAENKVGTKNVGVVAINAKFNDYGLYLQRLIDAVQVEFDRLAAGSTYPPPGSFVVVKWALNAEGKVTRIVNVDNHTTTVGAQVAVSAITNRAPFGPWTEAMKAVLNDEEELVFTFYYQ